MLHCTILYGLNSDCVHGTRVRYGTVILEFITCTYGRYGYAEYHMLCMILLYASLLIHSSLHDLSKPVL